MWVEVRAVAIHNEKVKFGTTDIWKKSENQYTAHYYIEEIQEIRHQIGDRVRADIRVETRQTLAGK